MRLVLAEDTVLLREGLAALLGEAGFEVVGQAGDGEEALRLIRSVHPDVAILDICMPPSHTDEGIQAAQKIRLTPPSGSWCCPSTSTPLTSSGSCPGERRGLGYLLKDRVSDVKELADAVERVGAGGTVIDPEVVTRLMDRRRIRSWAEKLTERERGVLELMAQGRSNHAIADQLCLCEKTVESHVRSIFTKLDLMPSTDDHRRVLAVLSYLRAPGADSEPEWRIPEDAD